MHYPSDTLLWKFILLISGSNDEKLSCCCSLSLYLLSVSSFDLFTTISFHYNQYCFSYMMLQYRHSVGCYEAAVGPFWWRAGLCGGVMVLPGVWSFMGLSSCAEVICCLCHMWSLSQASKQYVFSTTWSDSVTFSYSTATLWAALLLLLIALLYHALLVPNVDALLSKKAVSLSVWKGGEDSTSTHGCHTRFVSRKCPDLSGVYHRLLCAAVLLSGWPCFGWCCGSAGQLGLLLGWDCS